MSNQINKNFHTLYQEAFVLPFISRWSNGTGYFNNMVDRDFNKYSPILQPGEVAKSETGNGRKLIVIGYKDPGKNLIIFERYTKESARDHNALAFNLFNSDDLNVLFQSDLLDKETSRILDENIPAVIKMFSSL